MLRFHVLLLLLLLLMLLRFGTPANCVLNVYFLDIVIGDTVVAPVNRTHVSKIKNLKFDVIICVRLCTEQCGPKRINGTVDLARPPSSSFRVTLL